MISRRTARLLAEVLARKFRVRHSSTTYRKAGYHVNRDTLYDFLFDHSYEAWFCNAATKFYELGSLKKFLMKLHTGEAQLKATPDWTWEGRRELGQRLLRDLAEDILNDCSSTRDASKEWAKACDVNALLRGLELDGYVYGNSRLLSPESDVLDVEEETGVLQTLYATLRLANKDTAAHFLKRSEDHYTARRWDDSIGNSRKFLECVLQEVAAAHSSRVKRVELPDTVYQRPVEVRKYLAKEELLEKKEVEALADVYGLLSHTGSHPYMAENDQARLLRHMALTFSQFVMLRLQGCLVAQP